MEQPTQTLYNLELEVAAWRQNMLNGALTPEDVEELIQHLRDEMSALQAKGLSEEEAWLVARKRIGQPVAINEEFCKVNPDFTASRNLLMLFWGGTIFMVLQSFLFDLPGMLWFVVKLTTGNHIKHLVSNQQIGMILYAFCGVTLVLALLNLVRTNKVSAWFNRLLAKYSGVLSLLLVIIGSIVATLNFKRFASSIYYRDGNLDIPGHSVELLGILFYGSLIFCTAWFTMRFRRQEFKSLKNFSAGMNWITALSIGIMAELLVCIGNMMQTRALNYILIVLLFGPAGWMIAKSRKYLVNLLMLQLCALYVYGFVSYIQARHPFFVCASEYAAVLVAIFAGVLISKRNDNKLQMA